jgi:hypothetical protein
MLVTMIGPIQSCPYKGFSFEPDDVVTISCIQNPMPGDLDCAPDPFLTHLDGAFLFLSDGPQDLERDSDQVESAIGFIGEFFATYPGSRRGWHALLSAPFLADLPHNIHKVFLPQNSQFPLETGLWAATAIFRSAVFRESSELLASPLGCYLRDEFFLTDGPFFWERVRLAILAVRLEEDDFGRLLHYGVKRSLSGILPSGLADGVRYLLRSYWNGGLVREANFFCQAQGWFAMCIVSAIVEGHLAHGNVPDEELSALRCAMFSALLIIAPYFEAVHAEGLISRVDMMEWVDFLISGYSDATPADQHRVFVFLRKCLQWVWLWKSPEELRDLFLAVGPQLIALLEDTEEPEDGLLFLVILLRRGVYVLGDYEMFRDALPVLAHGTADSSRVSLCLLMELSAYWFEVLEGGADSRDLEEICACLSQAVRFQFPIN